MRICIVNPFYDAHWRSILGVPGRYRHLELLSSALADRGHDVVVVQAYHEERIERSNSAEFRCVRAPYRPAPRLAGGRVGVDFLLRKNLRRIIETMEAVRPDAVHMIGLALLQPLLEVSRWCSKTARPLVVSYHGGQPRPEPWLRGLQRGMLRRCQAVLFTSAAQAQPWLAKRLLEEEQVVPCMEVSSTFSPVARHEARAHTNMHGDPVFVWNARLHPIKDPLTALRGFALIRERWPAARLYMIYLTSEMQTAVVKAIAEIPALKQSVEMRGRIPREAVEDFLNSADFLIQSSLREFSSYSVLEAMSCGVIPVVTDIPAFRAMTDNGACGFLFPVGDYRAMAELTSACDLRNVPALSRKVREHFVRHLSYDAIARIYEAALAPRTAQAIPCPAST